MNLGVYISSMRNQNQMAEISDVMNSHTENGDASLFYDEIGYNPFKCKFGIFDSTNLWNFKGTLVTTSLETTLKSINIVNDINIYYYYGSEKKINPVALIHIKNKNVKFVCRDEESKKDLYRKTGEEKVSVCQTFEELLKVIQ